MNEKSHTDAVAQPTPAWRLFKDDGSYIVTDKRGAAVHWGAAGQMVEEIGRELRAAQPPAAPVETDWQIMYEAETRISAKQAAEIVQLREQIKAHQQSAAATGDEWLAPETFHSMPVRDRVHYTIKTLGSVNLTQDACDRQARRITDALEAAGLIPTEPQAAQVSEDDLIQAIVGLDNSAVSIASTLLQKFDVRPK